MEKKSLEDLRSNYKSLEVNRAHHAKNTQEADLIHSPGTGRHTLIKRRPEQDGHT